MNWKHGYFAESGYVHGHYPETMPTRLRWAALLQGHELPGSHFRYLDAGCGQGLHLVLAAACHPDSEFVGIDFLPEHIAHATSLASQCGLSNVTFIEGDFVRLAKEPSSLGVFDYAVCQGISTWVAPAVKLALFDLLGACLAPGGVFFNGYNTLPGWLGATPFQHLVRLLQRQHSGQVALSAAQTTMHQLRERHAGVFDQHPGLQVRLDSMKGLDTAYLVQEYNNEYWQPVFVTQMMDELAAAKLDYLGTATLPEAFDSNLPADLRDLLAQQTAVPLREQLRDYALNQSFRRDMYVKGRRRSWPVAHKALMAAQRFTLNPLTPQPALNEGWPLKGGSINLTGSPAFYGGIARALLSAGPDGLSVEEIKGQQPDALHREHVVLALSMMLHGGWVSLVADTNPSVDSKKANRALCTNMLAGAPYRQVCLPRTGSTQHLTDADCLMFSLDAEDVPMNAWPLAIHDTLERIAKANHPDGHAATDVAKSAALMLEGADLYANTKRPYLKSMGAY